MSDAILVLNAGSSSLKFAVFGDGDPPAPRLRGQVEGLAAQPHFVARDAAGNVIGEHQWPAGTQLGHAFHAIRRWWIDVALLNLRQVRRTDANKLCKLAQAESLLNPLLSERFAKCFALLLGHIATTVSVLHLRHAGSTLVLNEFISRPSSCD